MLASCAGSRSSAPPPPGFVDELIRHSERRNAVSGNLLVTTSADGHSATIPGVLLVAFPDQLRLELQDPVGGMLVLCVLHGDRFWLYRHDRAEILTGPLSALPAGLLPAVAAPDLVRLFLARPYADHLRQATAKGQEAIYRSGGLVDTVRWQGGLAEPSEWRLERRAAGGAGAFVGVGARYEDYEFKQDLRFPTKIHIEEFGAAGESREVLLAWKDWEPSVSSDKKLFQIPQSNSFGRKIKELR